MVAGGGMVACAGVVSADAHLHRSAFARQACVSFPPQGAPNGHSVFLDPGHGGIDPGATGVTAAGRAVVEKQLTLAIALATSRLLRGDGFAVTVSRIADTTVSRISGADRRGGALTAAAHQRELRARIRCANASRAQLLLGIHLDSFSDRSVGGTETIYSPARSFAPDSFRFARLVQHTLVARLRAAGWRVADRGIRSDAGQGRAALSAWERHYGHLLELGPARPPRFRDPTGMPGVIVEPLFISDPAEASIAASRRGQATISAALATAVKAYFGRDPARPPLRGFVRLGLPLYCGGSYGHDVALTFDDGPGPDTSATLRLLRRFGERATFFLVGRNLHDWPRLPRAETALGAVGDHTWTHPFLTRLPPATMQREIAATRTALQQSTGAPVLLFRPPYGFHDAAVDEEVRRLGMVQVLWSLDSHDSYPPPGASAAMITRTLARSLRPGSIVLLHENLRETQLALPAILRDLQSRDLESVSIPELLADDPPTLAQLRAGVQGCLDARGVTRSSSSPSRRLR